MSTKHTKMRLLSLCMLLLGTASSLSIKRPVRARESTYTALGCYTDNVNGKRALGDRSTAADDMTVAKCAAFCSEFDLFGVEYGRECYCANTRDSGSTKVELTDCSFPCAGDSSGTEKCGAGDRLNVYSNPNPTTEQPATLTGVTSLGCFADSGDRVLPNRIISANDMTAAKCAENCAGYSYFGTQYSSECYCGNTKPSVPATASECNMACSGNSAERCGSGMRLNVYEFDSTSSTDMTPTPGSSAPAATILGYAYQGCFTDNVPQRVLAGKTSADEAMTLEMCAAFCKVGGYSWFGLEYGRECYCGTKLDALSTKELESACDTTCSGNTFQKCGGPNHLNVYTNPTLSAPTEKSVTSLNGFRYKSCWTDKVDDRSLKAVDYRTDDMTVEKCADKCKGYAYFGLEYSRECFCGDNLSGKAAPESDCGMLCMGANKQWCGGPDRLNLYTQATDDSQFTSSSSPYSSSSSSSPSLTSEVASTSISGTSALSSSSPTSDIVSATLSGTFSTQASSTTSSILETMSYSSSSFSSQSSSLLPSSTSMTPMITTTTGPSLTTITNCPAAPTFAGPEYCYVSGSLPYACQQLTRKVNYVLAAGTLSQCLNQMSTRGATVVASAVSCFSSIPPRFSNEAAASATFGSVNACLAAPSASLYCQFDSACVTNTYTVANVPSPTPTPGIGDDLLGDGGFETGGLNNWSVKNYYGMELVNLRVDSSRPRTGNYAMAMNFKNENGLSIDFKRSMKVIPGRTYQIQAYYYATNPSTSACNLLVGADITYNQDSGFVGYPANAWLAKSLTFKATKSWYTLRFVFTCNVSEDKSGKTDVWFDDWTFKRLD